MLATWTAFGQYLNREQSIYDAPSGKALAQFKDSTQFFAHPSEDNWIRLSGVFFVPNEFVAEEDSVISAGAPIFSGVMQEVGKALEDLKLLEFDVVRGKKFKGYKRVRISGWIYHNRLHRESVPEFLIKDLIDKQRGSLTDRFIELMELYPIEKHETSDFTAYVFRAYGSDLSKKPDFQYILIDRGGQPYAVVAQGKPLDLSKAKHTETDRELHYTYLQKPNAAMRDAVQDLAFTFVKL